MSLKNLGIVFLAVFAPFGASVLWAADEAPLPSVNPLLLKPLPDIADKEVLVMEVVYPPGGADPIHRHDAHAFVYVLEGSIVMGVEGGETVTLGPGQTFYEGPDHLHVVGRNASTTKPAKFLVVMVKKTGVDPVLPIY